jgi:hypothetical protein
MERKLTDGPPSPKGTTPDRLPSHLDKPRLRRLQASEYLVQICGLVCSPATLAKLACVGGGPGFHRVGRIPLYPRDELDRWAAERLGPLLASTSENKGQRDAD